MRQRANVICTAIWAFNLGVWLMNKESPFWVAFSAAMLAVYGVASFRVAARFDRIEKEVLEEIKNKEND